MKGKRIEPGCLAMIVGYMRTRENLGRVVRVVSRPPEGWVPRGAELRVGPYNDDRATSWVVETTDASRPLAAVAEHPFNSIPLVYWAQETACDEAHLIRLDDDEAPEESNQHKELRDERQTH